MADESALPRVGDKAPNFTLPDQDGKTHSLREYVGKWVLVYFYPRDNTPGCTTEACAIRDDFDNFEKIDAVVLGISTDSIASHKKFADEYKLPFTLLADTEKEVVKKYGVYGEKRMMGKTFMGVKRSSFLVRPDGTIAKVYDKVKPADHSAEVLADIASV